jgi:hypothetical protein
MTPTVRVLLPRFKPRFVFDARTGVAKADQEPHRRNILRSQA